MLLCIIMVIGTIFTGVVVWGTMAFYTKVYNMFFRTKEDIDTKCEDFVSWYTKEKQDDVAKFVAEKRGGLMRKRILINAFKERKDLSKVRALTPPAFICANLPDSYLQKVSALSLAA